MMSTKELHKVSEKINTYLRLRTHPLGFKLFETIEEAKKVGWRPPNKLLICQVINTARIHGRALIATAEDSLCVIGAVALGLIETPSHMASGEIFLKLGYISDPEKAKKYQECFARLEPVYEAFAVKPLERVNFEPDVVLFYGNSAQISLALFALSVKYGERLQLSMFGESALCGGIAQAMITGKPQISVPCFGERVFAGTADDEILLIMPFSDLSKLISGLETLYKAGMRYPIPIAGCATTVEIASILRPDYEP